MAKFEQGINGPFSGKIGNVIGSSWRGIHYMKSRSQKTAPPSDSQLQNQHIFRLAQHWLSPLTEFVRAGFRKPSGASKGFTAAKSYLHANAMVRNGYESYIIPSRMLLSQGSLPMASDLTMAFDSDAAEINISWNPDKNDRQDHCTDASLKDQLMYVAYNIKGGEVFGEVYGPFRSEGNCQITIPSALKGKYHVYAAFQSADRQNQSDSCYLGDVEVE